jgi:hypothetical protein
MWIVDLKQLPKTEMTLFFRWHCGALNGLRYLQLHGPSVSTSGNQWTRNSEDHFFLFFEVGHAPSPSPR